MSRPPSRPVQNRLCAQDTSRSAATLPFALVQRSAWKGYSQNFVLRAFQEVRYPLTTPGNRKNYASWPMDRAFDMSILHLSGRLL